MNEELKHYGVKGMKWGVSRASKKLATASSEEERERAVEQLEKHRSKASAEINKLEIEKYRLEKKSDKYAMDNDIRAQRLKQRAAKKTKKAYGVLTTKSRSEKLLFKADKLNARADAMIAKSEKVKAKIAKNEKMTAAFKQGVKDIDKALIEKGRKYLNS